MEADGDRQVYQREGLEGSEGSKDITLLARSDITDQDRQALAGAGAGIDIRLDVQDLNQDLLVARREIHYGGEELHAIVDEVFFTNGAY